MPGPERGLLAAASFLTRLPLGRRAAGVTQGDLRAGAAWFPAIGAAIGWSVAAAGWLAAHRSPALVAALLAACLDAALTGALHLDGLADTADGLGAASSGRDGLRAMSDPGIGAFGAAALFLDLGLRSASMSALLAGGRFPWAIVAAAAAARFAPLALSRGLAYRRPNGGSGDWVRGSASPAALAIGGATAAAACLTAGPAPAVAILLTVAAVTAAIGALARRSFRGATGDVFGAATELAQTLGLTAAVLAGAG
jgi:adenosylcobinamide-GDP ribazoletransferase